MKCEIIKKYCDMRTDKEMHPDIYPFKKGDKVFIKWTEPQGATDTGTIHELEVGHFIVKIDGKNTVGVGRKCIFPIEDKEKYVQAIDYAK